RMRNTGFGHAEQFGQITHAEFTGEVQCVQQWSAVRVGQQLEELGQARGPLLADQAGPDRGDDLLVTAVGGQLEAFEDRIGRGHLHTYTYIHTFDFDATPSSPANRDRRALATRGHERLRGPVRGW